MEDKKYAVPAEDAEDEIFGELKQKIAEINAEAEESMFDGFVGKVFVWVRKYWRWILTALLIPLLNFGYEYYLYWTEFPVMPEIITEEEFRLMVAYDDVIEETLNYPTVKTQVKSGGRTLGSYRMYDTDGDGVGDIYVSLDKHGPLKSHGWRTVTDVDGNQTIEYYEELWEPQELELDSGTYRVHWLDVLLGKEEGFGVSSEDIFIYDHTGSLHMIVNQPLGDDHAELRALIVEMLQIAEKAKATGVPADREEPQNTQNVSDPLELMNQLIDILQEEQ